MFFEWTILAKGNERIDSAYVSFWTDIDIFTDPGFSSQNYPAVDSAGQFAYCVELPYSRGAAVGYALLAGPAVPQPGSTALVRGVLREGYSSLPLCGFHAIGDDNSRVPLYAQPYTLGELWKTVRGFDINGDEVLNPFTGVATRFPFNGDPSTGKGWVPENRFLGGGAGFMMHAGPFTLAPGDTQWVMIALTAAHGMVTSESVRLLRERIAALRALPYDSIQQGSFARISCEGDIGPIDPLPTLLALSAPYPNPIGSVGYFRLLLPEEEYVSLEVVDLLGRRVALLIDEVRAAGAYDVRFSRGALAAGLYICRLRTRLQDIDVKFLLSPRRILRTRD